MCRSSALIDEYNAAVELPAAKTFDFRVKDSFCTESGPGPGYIEVLRDSETDQSLAWVIPRVLSREECESIIRLGEDAGITLPPYKVLRTSKRTTNYTNKDLSDLIFPRIQPFIEANIGESNMEDTGKLYGLHHNWRILRYDPPGDAFPCHQDQMDSFQLKQDDGTGRKDLVYSSHTFLVSLSEDGTVRGGATRFFPSAGKLKRAYVEESVQSGGLSHEDIYGGSVDVYLPRGWGLVFRQYGLMHAGQPVLPKGGLDNSGGGSKYVAQSGVLRMLPEHKLLPKPSVFKYGPGLMKELEDRAKALMRGK